MNSGNDNLPPAKGNTPKGNPANPNPAPDSRRKARRAQQAGQKGAKQEPGLPEIKPQPMPIPSTSPPLLPKPDSFVAKQPHSAEPTRPLSKGTYPLRLVITFLSLLILGLLGMGSFLLVSPDGKSIKLYTEPTPERLDLLKQSRAPIPAAPVIKPVAKGSKAQ
ncbi:MAG: hypothetical protein WCA07_09795 [Gloeobacterales cyanobacterium]